MIYSITMYHIAMLENEKLSVNICGNIDAYDITAVVCTLTSWQL